MELRNIAVKMMFTFFIIVFLIGKLSYIVNTNLYYRVLELALLGCVIAYFFNKAMSKIDDKNSTYITQNLLNYIRYFARVLFIFSIFTVIALIPVLFDFVVTVFLKLGESHTLSNLKYINNNGVSSGELISSILSFFSIVIMAYISYLSYKINKQQFDIIRSINDTKPTISVNGSKTTFSVNILMSDISEMINKKYLQMPIEDVIVAATNSELTYSKLIYRSVVAKSIYHIYCNIENKMVFIKSLVESKIILDLKYHAKILKCVIDENNDLNYSIVSSSKLTKYEVEYEKKGYDSVNSSEQVSVEVQFETEHEVVCVAAFFDSQKAHLELNRILLELLKRVDKDNWNNGISSVCLNVQKYNNLSELLEVNKDVKITLYVESNIFKQKRARRDKYDFISELRPKNYE